MINTGFENHNELRRSRCHACAYHCSTQRASKGWARFDALEPCLRPLSYVSLDYDERSNKVVARCSLVVCPAATRPRVYPGSRCILNLSHCGAAARRPLPYLTLGAPTPRPPAKIPDGDRSRSLDNPYPRSAKVAPTPDVDPGPGYPARKCTRPPPN